MGRHGRHQIHQGKIKTVKEGLRRVPNVRVHADIPRWAYVQALLSRGDRRTADLLLLAMENDYNWPTHIEKLAHQRRLLCPARTAKRRIAALGFYR